MLLTWELQLGIFGLGSLFGIFGLGFFVFFGGGFGIFGLGSLAWDLWFGIFGLGSVVWDLCFGFQGVGIFGLGSLVWDLWFGICGLGFFLVMFLFWFLVFLKKNTKESFFVLNVFWDLRLQDPRISQDLQILGELPGRGLGEPCRAAHRHWPVRSCIRTLQDT